MGQKGLQEHRGAANAPTLTPAQERQFCERIEAEPRPEDRVCSLRSREFQRILQEEFGISRSLASTYLLLHELGYSCLRPRPKHRKADAEKQAAFLAALPNLIREIAARHPDIIIRTMWQDEARFGQQGTLTNVWARTGSRPTAVRRTEYKYVWVMGAVCPETGFAEGLICPRMDAECVNIFLQQLSSRIPRTSMWSCYAMEQAFIGAAKS